MSSRPIRVDESKRQDSFLVHSGGRATGVDRRKRKWFYVGIVVFVAILAGMGIPPRSSSEGQNGVSKQLKVTGLGE